MKKSRRLDEIARHAALPGWVVDAVLPGVPMKVLVTPAGGVAPVCPDCGAGADQVVRFGQVRSDVAEPPVRGVPVTLSVRRARHRCNACGRIFLQSAPMLSPRARVTRRCAEYVADQLDLVPVPVIAEALGVEEVTLHRIAMVLGRADGPGPSADWPSLERLCVCALCLARFDRGGARRTRIIPFAARSPRAADALVCPTCAATGASLWLKLQT